MRAAFCAHALAFFCCSRLISCDDAPGYGLYRQDSPANASSALGRRGGLPDKDTPLTGQGGWPTTVEISSTSTTSQGSSRVELIALDGPHRTRGNVPARRSMATAGQRYISLTPAEVAAVTKTPGITFIDVRFPDEYAAGHVKETINIPFNLKTPGGEARNPSFLALVQEAVPDKSATIVLLCQSGRRSALAAEALVAQRYTHVFHMAGGYLAWVAQGLVLVI